LHPLAIQTDEKIGHTSNMSVTHRKPILFWWFHAGRHQKVSARWVLPGRRDPGLHYTKKPRVTLQLADPSRRFHENFDQRGWEVVRRQTDWRTTTWTGWLASLLLLQSSMESSVKASRGARCQGQRWSDHIECSRPARRDKLQ